MKNDIYTILGRTFSVRVVRASAFEVIKSNLAKVQHTKVVLLRCYITKPANGLILGGYHA
jgi:hypothetical protein